MFAALPEPSRRGGRTMSGNRMDTAITEALDTANPGCAEAHRNTISIVSPQFFNQPVVQLFRPLAFQELDDLLSPVGKFGAISPTRVDCITQRHLFWIPRIPSILCQANFLNGSLTSKWR